MQTQRVEDVMAYVHGGKTQDDGSVAFEIVLDVAVPRAKLRELEEVLKKVTVRGTERLMPRSFSILRNGHASAVFADPLSNHDFKQALKILTARLRIHGYVQSTPRIPDPAHTKK
ncbi:MAG: hypothetical protein JWP06_525 [Candidatus Saccharibacteria bacterium]|nr:hypothetical protein [Candidatus Saccharibacteria bacterium]